MLNKMPEWAALCTHQETLSRITIKALFDEQDGDGRFNDFHLALDGMLFDYSKHRVTKDTIALLCDFARARDLEGYRARMLRGDLINCSEKRAVLHCALRGSTDPDLNIDGENVTDFVAQSLEQMRRISDDIRANAAITDVVNIGIGGSDLGPRIAGEALRFHADGPRVHYIANVDGHRIDALMKRLKPQNTVFIVASKTFTTQETIMNARTAQAWMVDALGDEAGNARFYGVTSNGAQAKEFGIVDGHVLPMRDWVGGRFSVWGTIGLPFMVAIGYERFCAFLDGAKAVDEHFQTAPLEENIPVLMALLGIWNSNFCGYDAHAVIPYAQTMTNFSRYLQQLEMESNGKSAGISGDMVGVPTAPILFGEPGTNAQHAFFQLLHQGTQIVPVDFITFINPMHDLKTHNDVLLANALAQSQALLEGDQTPGDAQRNFDGNRPSSMMMFDKLDCRSFGMLLALYEHKVFVQGVIWGINSFDQWGVELGKKLAREIEGALSDPHGQSLGDADSSTQNLIRHILKKSV